MVEPFIEAKYCRDGNIQAFEIVHTKWVPEGTVLKRLKILKLYSSPLVQLGCLQYASQDSNKTVLV